MIDAHRDLAGSGAAHLMQTDAGSQEYNRLRTVVLTRIDRIGKGRYAQRLAAHLEGLARR